MERHDLKWKKRKLSPISKGIKITKYDIEKNK